LTASLGSALIVFALETGAAGTTEATAPVVSAGLTLALRLTYLRNTRCAAVVLNDAGLLIELAIYELGFSVRALNEGFSIASPSLGDTGRFAGAR